MLALLVVVPTLVTLATGAASQVVQALPPEFDDVIVTSSVSRPTAVEALPNGRVVVLEQHTGRVRLIVADSGALLPTPALTLSVCTANEQGLLGFTEDPDFARTGRVYVFYTRPSPAGCVNRVSAFRMAGDIIVPTSEQVLIDNISSINGNHNAGDVEVGNDGYLYIATGDAGRDPRGNSGSAGANDAAQDLSLLNGKILRLDRQTGQPAPGNPIGGAGTVACGSRGNNSGTPTTSCREIFAWGLRNPFRFAFDPNTSATRFFINDVGQSGASQREEVNVGVNGANYGWNTCEGPCSTPGLTNPIESYPNSTGRYITGAAFVPDGAWPERFDGGYLFADGGSGKVWFRDAAGSPVDYGDAFLSGKSGITDMAFVLESSGWALYYVRVFSGQVGKITFGTSPSPPAGPLAFERLPTATRPFDSRTTAPPARIRGGRTRLISLGPEAVGAEAALVNITLASPSATTFATVWAPRTTRPATSNLNALAGEDVANASIVPVDEQGRILVYTQATTDVIVDLAGVFTSASGPVSAGRFEPADTNRVADTRQPLGPDNQFTRSGAVVNVPIRSRAGVPAGGVDAVVLVVAGIAPPAPATGWLAAYAGGTTRPPSSNLNVNGGTDTRTNLVVVPLGADGSIDLFLSRVDDVIVEVIGWFTDGSAPALAQGRFHLVNPTREVDTRNGIGPFGPLAHLSQNTLNPGSVPNGASAVAQNLTFAPTGGWGFVGAFASFPAPLVTNLNGTRPGQTRAALALTPLHPSGSETFRAESPVNLAPHQFLVDVFGFFD